VLYLIIKLRKIHLYLYDIKSSFFRELSLTFDQTQCLHALYLDLNFEKSFPKTRLWAGSPDFLMTLKELIEENKPMIIVECSSGVSTIIIAKTLKILGCGHVYSLEHNLDYKVKTDEQLHRHDLCDWATVIHAPLKDYFIEDEAWLWYDIDEIGTRQIDMLVIDGPPATINKLARFPAYPLLSNNFSAEIKIILDDANRVGEQEIVKSWREKTSLDVESKFCEKGCIVLSPVTSA